MPRPEKVAVVEEIQQKLAGSAAAVLTEYRGLTVAELAELRSTLRPLGAEHKIFKNTLARRAAEVAGLTDLADLLEGPVAITFINGDAVPATKALRDFSRTNPLLVLKGGLLGTRVLGAGDVAALADIQPREVLLARIAGGFQAPLTKAAGLFQAMTRNMAYGVKALIDQRVAAGESSGEPEAPVASEVAKAEAEPGPEAAAEASPAVEGVVSESATEAEPAGAEVPAVSADDVSDVVTPEESE